MVSKKMKRNNRFRTGVGIVLAACLCLGITACGNTESSAGVVQPGDSEMAVKIASVAEEAAMSARAALTGRVSQVQAAMQAEQAAVAATAQKYSMIQTASLIPCLRELDENEPSHVGNQPANEEEEGWDNAWYGWVDDGFPIQTLGGWQLPEQINKELQTMLTSVYAPGFTMGFMMLDIQSGKGICYNSDAPFYSAGSTLASYAISLAATRPEVLSQRQDVLIAAATEADFNSYYILQEDYGLDALRSYARAVGVDLSPDQDGGSEITAEDLTRLWLANYDYFTVSDNGERIGSWFEEPGYSAIRPILGDRYMTRSKAGWTTGMYGVSIDAGIVYAGENPYVVVVMTDFPAILEDVQETFDVLDRIHNVMTGALTVSEAAGEETEEGEGVEATSEAAPEDENVIVIPEDNSGSYNDAMQEVTRQNREAANTETENAETDGEEADGTESSESTAEEAESE